MPAYQRVLTLIALCIGLPSCIQAPDKLTPSLDGNLDLKSTFVESSASSPQLANSLLKIFPTSEANKYLKLALSNNPSIKSSLAQIEEFKLRLKQSGADQKPTINFNSSAGRNGSGGSSTSRYSLNADASWEIDVWKKLDTQVLASKNDLLIQEFNHKAARESIAAQTLQAWITLVETQKLLNLAKERAASLSKTFDLVNRKFENGTSNLGALRIAESNLENTRRNIPLTENTRDQASRSLSILIGKHPTSSLRASNWPNSIRGVRRSTPLSVLTRRPDIQSAYRQIQAADLQVSIAHKELYPDITLTSNIGQQSNILNRLADNNFNTWSLLANLSTPLFDAGKRKLEIAIQQELTKQAVFNYQSTVLEALSEVENALGSEIKFAASEKHTKAALTAAIEAEQRLQGQFENGLVDILDLLETQRNRFNAEEALISLQADRYTNRITLALAVGTGI